jgi:hypothetical protein
MTTLLHQGSIKVSNNDHILNSSWLLVQSITYTYIYIYIYNVPAVPLSCATIRAAADAFNNCLLVQCSICIAQ